MVARMAGWPPLPISGQLGACGVPGGPEGQGQEVSGHPPGKASKINQLGAPLLWLARQPDMDLYEEVNRVEPNDSWFDIDRNPSNPTKFEILSIHTGPNKIFFIFDYSVTVYGFSGLNAHDFEPLEEGRHSGSFGYVLENNGRGVGFVRYRLNPVSPTLRTQTSQSSKVGIQPASQLTADDFARTAADDFGSAAGYGGTIHPQRPGRFGAPNANFCIYVLPDTTLDMTGVVFNPIESPVAFVEGRASGYVCTSQIGYKVIEDMIETMR